MTCPILQYGCAIDSVIIPTCSTLTSTEVVGILGTIPELGRGLHGAAWASLPEACVSPQVRLELLLVSSPISPLSCRAARRGLSVCAEVETVAVLHNLARWRCSDKICLNRTTPQICESAVNVTLSVYSASVSHGKCCTLHSQPFLFLFFFLKKKKRTKQLGSCKDSLYLLKEDFGFALQQVTAVTSYVFHKLGLKDYNFDRWKRKLEETKVEHVIYFTALCLAWVLVIDAIVLELTLLTNGRDGFFSYFNHALCLYSGHRFCA